MREKKKGTGIIRKEVQDLEKMQKVLKKEWSTWSKDNAVAFIPAMRTTKNISPDLVLESKLVWTNKSEDMDQFEPKA
eukprot:16439929-Heterocapsa_arctica.AAC.1